MCFAIAFNTLFGHWTQCWDFEDCLSIFTFKICAFRAGSHHSDSGIMIWVIGKLGLWSLIRLFGQSVLTMGLRTWGCKACFCSRPCFVEESHDLLEKRSNCVGATLSVHSMYNPDNYIVIQHKKTITQKNYSQWTLHIRNLWGNLRLLVSLCSLLDQ